MAKYLVEINGRNLLIEMDGRVARYGFVTHRGVEATDPQAAENAAVQMIRETASLRELIRNPPGDPPYMDVTGIAEIDSFDQIENPEPGFIWYSEDEGSEV